MNFSKNPMENFLNDDELDLRLVTNFPTHVIRINSALYLTAQQK